MKLNKYLGGTAIAAVLSLASVPSFAQEAPSAEKLDGGEQTPPVKDEDLSSDDIVVVGSLLRKNNFNSAAPITILNVESELDKGRTSASSILQSNAITGGSAQINNSYGGFVVDGGAGTNTIGLRGLGAARSLVLLNGHRVSPAGTGSGVTSVDLNLQPPLDIIDRFEVLRDGASSTYGSDAVGGVVNIVTSTKLKGIRASARISAPSQTGGGSKSLSISFGHVGDRFSVQGAFGYHRTDPMTLGDRPWSRCQVDGGRGANETLDPRTGQPKCYSITTSATKGNNGVTINTLGTADIIGIGAPGAAAVGIFNRWRPNSAVSEGLPGFEGVGGTGTSLAVRDTFDPRMLNRQIFGPTTTYTGFLSGSYDVRALGDAQLYFSALAGDRQSSYNGIGQINFDYPMDSPLIPSPLAEQLKGKIFLPTGASLMLDGPAAARVFALDPREFVSRQSVQNFRMDAGIKGQLGIGDWRYDLYLGYSWANGKYTGLTTLKSPLAQSMKIVGTAAGGFACSDVSNGCVPAPQLTAATIGGDLPKDWLNFITGTTVGKTKTDLKSAQFTVNGTLFSLPYGSLRTAIGAEIVSMKLRDVPSMYEQTAAQYCCTGPTAAITSGSDRSIAVFGEAEIPLLSGLPFAEELTLNASGRFTNYRSYGTGWTYKVSGLYSPTKWLSFRASYGTSFRAPSLKEQFQGATLSSVASTLDPCNEYGQSQNDALKAHCGAEGLDPTFRNVSGGITVVSQGGRDTGLKAETATNFTAGIVLQPSLPHSLGTLKISADYYNIVINGGIGRAQTELILDLCYEDQNWQNDKASDYCRFVSRDEINKNNVTVKNNYYNISYQGVKGLDFQLIYSKELGKLNFYLDGIVTRYLAQKSQTQSGRRPVDANGTVGSPEWTGELNASLRYRQVQLNYTLNFVSKTDSYEWYGMNPEVFKMDTPDYFTHSASIRFNLEKFALTAGVSNILNTEPPRISTLAMARLGNVPLYSGYDIVGRTFFVNATSRF